MKKIKIKIQEQQNNMTLDVADIDDMLNQMDEQALRAAMLSLPEDVKRAIATQYVGGTTTEPNMQSEGLVGLTEHILVEQEFYDLYDDLQDAIDENGETPCPQCLYEVLSEASCGCPDLIPEAKYRGRKVKLNKPMRGDVKKFKVYVKNAKGNVVKVNFGDKKMRIKKSNPKRRKSFRARHNCKNPGPKWKARYWSCRKW